MLQVGPEDLRVGVDGGLDLWESLRTRLTPQIAVGDWDGASRGALQRFEEAGTTLVTLPREKDQSDLACALRVLQELAPEEIVLLGFTGGRADHHLSNLLEIFRFVAQQQVPVVAFGPEAEYHFLTAQSVFRLRRPRGTLVSVFALGKATEGITMKGFDYTMKQGRLEPSSHGLSNRTCSREAQIRFRKGALLLVIPSEQDA